jgi:uncharacterized protein (DUF58 family)
VWSRKSKLLMGMALSVLVAGGWSDSPRLELFGFAIALLLLAEWIRFRAAVLRHGLTLERTFGGLSRAGCCWLEDTVTVTVRLRNSSSRLWPHIELHDIVPPHFEIAHSPAAWQGVLKPRDSIAWRYPIRAGRIGRARFPGVSCTLINWGGLFFENIFIEHPTSLSIYPEVFRKRTTPAFRKKYNRFRMHGIHQHRRPGTGSELLELRDYVPGDPPQTIAWKASARRDQIITREFESEVPIRVSLLLDASASIRVGDGRQTQLDSAIALLAQFAKLALESRDFVGLVTFTENQETILRPGRSRTHLLRLLERLTSFGNVSPGQSLGDFEGLFDTVETYLRLRHPQLWSRTLNHYPMPFMTLEFGASLRRLARFKKVAAVLAAVFELNPAAIDHAVADPKFMASLLSKYCERESLWVGRGFSEAVLEVCRESGPKLAVLERSLRYSIRRAKDNELYIILANFAMLEDRLEPVISAARTAIARHHRVLVVNPWLGTYFDGSRVQWTQHSPAAVLEALVRERYRRSHEAVEQKFLQSGIPYAVLHAEDTVAYLLAHVDRLRQHHGVPA